MELIAKQFTLVLFLLTSILMTAPVSGYAEVLPCITHTETDYVAMKISIHGHNFGSTTGPVKLGNYPVLAVVSWVSEKIVATLPVGIGPGTYLLRVTVPNKTNADPFMAALCVALCVGSSQGQLGPATVIGFKQDGSLICAVPTPARPVYWRDLRPRPSDR